MLINQSIAEGPFDSSEDCFQIAPPHFAFLSPLMVIVHRGPAHRDPRVGRFHCRPSTVLESIYEGGGRVYAKGIIS